MEALNLFKISGDRAICREHRLLVVDDKLSDVSVSESRERKEKTCFFFEYSKFSYFNYGSVNCSSFNYSQRYFRIPFSVSLKS